MLARSKRSALTPGDKTPLFLDVGRGTRGVLCLHGFTGTPFEVRPLAEALAGHGFTVIAPALAGHCGTVEELARTRWPDWLASAEAGRDRLLARGHGARGGLAGISPVGHLEARLAGRPPPNVRGHT